ncbi:MAG: GNAT family N-acetyltransferase [Synergistaceae bacterium]|nr:GNAT family N-acetyltransferase [Synergistaceae bacterium]
MYSRKRPPNSGPFFFAAREKYPWHPWFIKEEKIEPCRDRGAESDERMGNIVVKTERLRVVCAGVEELRALYDEESDGGMKQAYGEMLEAMRKLPGREEWGSYWKICLASGAQGSVEIGYGIDEAHRGNGYATEAVRGVIKWASEQDGVRCVTAQTDEDNDASRKVLLNSGFLRSGRGDEGPLYKKVFVSPR